MRRILASAALALAIAAQAGMTPPDELVKNVMLDIQHIIAGDKSLQAGNREKNIHLIEQKALPYFDHVAMTALAVGPNWRKAGTEQKKRLAEAFRTLLVRTYASSLSAFGDQKLEFRPLNLKPDDTDVTVQVRVLKSGAQPVAVEYDMEKTADGWKCYDVRVAGISLVVNYRTEFATIVRDKGIDGLIAALEEKNRALASADPGAKR